MKRSASQLIRYGDTVRIRAGVVVEWPNTDHVSTTGVVRSLSATMVFVRWRPPHEGSTWIQVSKLERVE